MAAETPDEKTEHIWENAANVHSSHFDAAYVRITHLTFVSSTWLVCSFDAPYCSVSSPEQEYRSGCPSPFSKMSPTSLLSKNPQRSQGGLLVIYSCIRMVSADRLATQSEPRYFTGAHLHLVRSQSICRHHPQGGWVGVSSRKATKKGQRLTRRGSGCNRSPAACPTGLKSGGGFVASSQVVT